MIKIIAAIIVIMFILCSIFVILREKNNDKHAILVSTLKFVTLLVASLGILGAIVFLF